jgi:hypothetical protein
MSLATDIQALAQTVAAQTTLPESVRVLMVGIADLFDAGYTANQLATAFRSVVTDPNDANRQVAVGVLLGELISRNTSHIAVDITDPLIPTAQRAFRKLRANRPALVAALEAALDNAGD